MARKILNLLWIYLVFVSCIVKAGEVYIPPNIVRINNILMTEYDAEKIFRDARKKHLDIFDAKNEGVRVDAVTKDADVIIRGSELMDEVTRLYNKAISNGDERGITYE